MAKNIFLFFSLLVAFLLKGILDNPVSLTPSFTEKTIVPGEDLVTEILIKKGDLSSYAKLQLEIPEGITVSVIESKSASFTFNNQKAKFIWLSLPTDEEFRIKFILRADEGAEGEKIISSQFSYLRNTDKEVVKMQDIVLNISKQDVSNKTINNANPVNKLVNNENTETKTETKTTALTEVSCSRTVSPISDLHREFKVEVTFEKSNLTGFAKFEDVIPAGFKATAIETKNALFSFTAQKVKFVWMSLPQQNEIKFSYKLVADKTISGQFFINGEFSFTEQDGETRKCILKQDGLFVKQQETPNTAMAPQPKTKTEGTNQKPTAAVTPKAPKETSQKPKNTAPTEIQQPKLIQYRIQIAAGKNLVGQDYFIKKYNITEQVYPELHNGLNKYSIGEFDLYQDARDYRDKITQNHNIDTGPFVIAYNYNKRITVQEALMISNQRWVK